MFVLIQYDQADISAPAYALGPLCLELEVCGYFSKSLERRDHVLRVLHVVLDYSHVLGFEDMVVTSNSCGS